VPTSTSAVALSTGVEGLAYTASVQAQWIRAAHLWGVAHTLRKTIHAAVPPILDLMYERIVAKVRVHLGEAVFAAALAEGKAIMPTQILDPGFIGNEPESPHLLK